MISWKFKTLSYFKLFNFQLDSDIRVLFITEIHRLSGGEPSQIFKTSNSDSPARDNSSNNDCSVADCNHAQLQPGRIQLVNHFATFHSSRTGKL